MVDEESARLRARIRLEWLRVADYMTDTLAAPFMRIALDPDLDLDARRRRVNEVLSDWSKHPLDELTIR
jgi:hypothetical protein